MGSPVTALPDGAIPMPAGTMQRQQHQHQHQLHQMPINAPTPQQPNQRAQSFGAAAAGVRVQDFTRSAGLPLASLPHSPADPRRGVQTIPHTPAAPPALPQSAALASLQPSPITINGAMPNNLPAAVANYVQGIPQPVMSIGLAQASAPLGHLQQENPAAPYPGSTTNSDAQAELLRLSQMARSGSQGDHFASATPSVLAPQASQRGERPQLSNINTGFAQYPGNAAGASGPNSAGADRPRSATQPMPPPAEETATIGKIGVLLDEVVSLASNARSLFYKGDHGPSSVCLGELSKSLVKIGELGSQSLARVQEVQAGASVPEKLQQSATQQPQQGNSQRKPSSGQQTNVSPVDIASASMPNLPLESPGIRKRAINPMEELPMKTMRGQHGVPIEPPAPPPSAPPVLRPELQADQSLGPAFEPTSRPNAPPPLLHTASAPLVPQLKTVGGPSPLGHPQMQAQGWHDPGSGAPTSSSGATPQAPSPAPASQLTAAAQLANTFQSLPGSPQVAGGPSHHRTKSLLDEAFTGSKTGSPLVPQAGDDDQPWGGDHSTGSGDESWSPSDEIDESMAAFLRGGQAQSSVNGDGHPEGSHGTSLKGATEAPDMPGRGTIPPLAPHLQEKLDALFYQYLRYVCAHNDCSDSKGEGIHQTLMPKRMSRLNHSEDFRPFKFRIQAFVNRWQEEVYKTGITEEQCSAKRLRQYLWTQPYISRFNEDGRKAKSKGNHVWIVEGRKLSNEEWEFQRFERKIVSPSEKAAYHGVPWSWTLRVWDPQMSALSIKPTFTVNAKPDWLDFVDGDEGSEKSLTGTPGNNAQSALVSVSAQCVQSNGTPQNLELSFDLVVSTRPADGKAPSGASETLQAMADRMARAAVPVNEATLMPEMFQMPSQSAPVGMPPPASFPIPGSMLPPAPAQARSMMSSAQPSVDPFPSFNLPTQANAPGDGTPAATAAHNTSASDATSFFASMNYPFTPPEAFASHPPLFFNDAQGDSPMPAAADPLASLDTSSLHAGLGSSQLQHPTMNQMLPPQIPPQLHAQSGLPLGGIVQLAPDQAPPLTAPAGAGGLEPHSQVQRAQVRAIIEKMQRDQTASLSLNLPERRRSQTNQHEVQAAIDQAAAAIAQQDGRPQDQQRQMPAPVPNDPHGQPRQQQAPSQQATPTMPLNALNTAVQMPPPGFINSPVQPGNAMNSAAGAGLMHSSLDPSLSPALGMGPFADMQFQQPPPPQ